MLQFYFLSVFLNGAAGYVLMAGDELWGDGGEKGVRVAVSRETPRLILGLLCLITGLLKVLSPVEGDIPVIGDILSALSGCAAGFVLIFEYYRDHTALELENTGRIEQVFVKNKRLIGFISLAAAILHFLFPRALFL